MVWSLYAALVSLSKLATVTESDKGLGCFILILLVLDGTFENNSCSLANWPVPPSPLAQSAQADGQQCYSAVLR